MTATLITVSVYSLWTAIGLYMAAFTAFAFDLGARAAANTVGSEPGTIAADARPRRAARVATALTVLGFVMHLTATVTRGIAAGRVPWDNLFGFALVSTLLVMAVYLLVLLWVDLRFIGAFVTVLIVVLLGGASTLYYVDVTPLDPALNSVWLVLHVIVAAISMGLFGVGFALSVAQLLRGRWPLDEAHRSPGRRLLATFPDSNRLETLAYQLNIVGFVLWTFTLVAGSVWAEEAWGRFWGWDVKETWTFIIWVIYAGYIHARATRGWRGARSAWLSIVGFLAVIFNTTVVNTLFKGLHSYSGLSS